MTGKFSENSQKVLNNSFSISRDMGHSYVGSEHLLLGILSDENSFAAKELNRRGVYYQIVKKRIASISGTVAKSENFGAYRTART